MWWWMWACTTSSPTMPPAPAPAPTPDTVPASTCEATGRPTSIAVETSVIPLRATEAIRRRLELVEHPDACTGDHCRAVEEAVFSEAVQAALPVLALAVAPQRSSPHAPTTRLRVQWGKESCEAYDGRTQRVVEREQLEAAHDQLKALWLKASPVE